MPQYSQYRDPMWNMFQLLSGLRLRFEPRPLLFPEMPFQPVEICPVLHFHAQS